MKKYEVLVDFGKQGFNETGSIFTVLKLIWRHSGTAKVTVMFLRCPRR